MIIQFFTCKSKIISCCEKKCGDLVCKFTLLVVSPESNIWHRFYSLSFFIQWNACLHMTCVGHVRGNFNDYFSWNNGMCSQLILRANSLKYVPQLFFMLTCSSATAMQCSVKIVSELLLGRQLISFDKKKFSSKKPHRFATCKINYVDMSKKSLLTCKIIIYRVRTVLILESSRLIFFLQNVCSNSPRKGGGGIIISFLYNILNYNTYMSIVSNCVRSFICFPWFVIFALIDNINATCTSV